MSGADGFRIARPAARPVRIPMTPLIDVMLILLVFFMVTSSYLDLDMIPMAGDGGAGPGAAAPPAAGGPDAPEAARALLVRIAADGSAMLRGAAMDADALTAAIAAAGGPQVLVLPSPAAPTQALVDVLGAAERAGAASVQVVRLRPAAGG
ncbi:ExbD/TolR family protein [Rubrimonas cliftonensis]|uniref:Biopolymer transport protein ExbD n=1 Tax=Rubrimonas cliftonensis TaxID=89524 RepID=A0A1H4BGH9_9RHOB|nr:biopolymer transporter ExbD [Rubrimonas cliftonensis]SEA47273.1 biopolymer transport protein ExbD [Rubrimonas cliftonensis]